MVRPGGANPNDKTVVINPPRAYHNEGANENLTPALLGTIPVEQKSVHWLSMGAAGRNDLLRSFCTAAL